MTRKRILIITAAALAAALLLLPLAAGIAHALGVDAFNLDWHVQSGGGGGGRMTGSHYGLTGTLGQVAAGPAANGPFVINQGFWNALLIGPRLFFLPAVMKQ
jgi:hypothetical protein